MLKGFGELSDAPDGDRGFLLKAEKADEDCASGERLCGSCAAMSFDLAGLNFNSGMGSGPS